MWNSTIEVLTTAATWPWLPGITNLAHAATALIGLGIAAHRAARYMFDRHRR